MNLLHVLRSRPDRQTRRLITALSEGNRCRVIGLYDEPIDYDRLVKLVFAADRVVSWW